MIIFSVCTLCIIIYPNQRPAFEVRLLKMSAETTTIIKITSIRGTFRLYFYLRYRWKRANQNRSLNEVGQGMKVCPKDSDAIFNGLPCRERESDRSEKPAG